MSQSYVPLKPILVTDPVTDVNAVRSYAVLQGGSHISWKPYTSTSISNSSIQFSCPPPSAGVIVDRMVMLTLPVRLTFTGALISSSGAFTNTLSLLNAQKDAPRAYPVSSALDTLQVGINNDSVSINMSDVIHPLLRYNIDEKLRSRAYSTTPNYEDQSCNYQDLFGDNRNPLNDYGAGLESISVHRGGFPFTIVSNTAVLSTTGAGTAATSVVDMIITEPLFLSPFFFGSPCCDTQGFFNVNAMDFNLTFLSNGGFRMWSHINLVESSGANTITSSISNVSMQFSNFSGPAFSYPGAQPKMLFKYITPNILSKQVLSPNMPYTYPYFDIVRYPTDIGTIANSAGAQQIQSNNIQLNQIPRRIYVLARPSNSVLNSRCDIPDAYLAIEAISIQFANQSTLMSSATKEQLYQINVKNHSSQTWPEWSGLPVQNTAFAPTVGAQPFGACGGPLCLEFGTDISLPDASDSPGKQGQYQIQVQVTFRNQNLTGDWDNLAMTMYLIVINEGSFTVTGTGSAQHQLGLLSTTDILDAQTQPGVNYRQIQGVNGGDFWSGLRDFGSKVNDFLKESKVISNVASIIPHPIAQGIATGAKSIGYGGCDSDASGGVAIGGAYISKKALKQSLSHRGR